ncbi:hypothetical protein MBLNU13_g08620t2 [Cladosporium sp. NU13]
MPPVIHNIYSQSTKTWQYVVADRTTGYCIILDPVRDHCVDRATISTIAADAIVDIVRTHGYTVDYILETHAAGPQYLSAAWYLRMQFSALQNEPPQLCDEVTVTGLEALWRRKYGANNNFSTSIRGGLYDGESVRFGRLSLTCIHLPGFAAPYRRAYLIGKDVFGAHSIAALTEEPPNFCPKNPPESHVEESERHLDAWRSIKQILSFSGDTRLWQDSGDHTVEELQPLHVSQCVALSKYAGLSEADFLTRRLAETQASREQHQRPPSYKAISLGSRLGSWIGV